MVPHRTHPPRLLAIDPSSKDFAFAVLEGLHLLVDWGTREATGEKNESCVRQVEKLVHWYRPTMIVLEETHGDTRRVPRVRLLLNAIAGMSLRHNIPVSRVPPSRVQIACGTSETAPKYLIHRGVLARFPELRRQLPERRKPWKSEDHRAGVFDAIALAVTAALAIYNKRWRREAA